MSTDDAAVAGTFKSGEPAGSTISNASDKGDDGAAVGVATSLSATRSPDPAAHMPESEVDGSSRPLSLLTGSSSNISSRVTSDNASTHGNTAVASNVPAVKRERKAAENLNIPELRHLGSEFVE